VECLEKTVIFIVLMEVVFWGCDDISTDRSLTTFRRRFMHPSSESKKFTLLKLYLRFFFSKFEFAGSSETKLFTDPHGI